MMAKMGFALKVNLGFVPVCARRGDSTKMCSVWTRVGVVLPLLVPWGWSRRTAEVSVPGSSRTINLAVTLK